MKKELELYLHIPFCIRKCEYCDFLSGPADEKSRRVYLDAMLRELAAVGPQAKEYEVISVYIGGGTPSLLPGDWMEELMEVVRDTYCLKKDAEISMEANPGTLTAINLAGYHRAGINRLSLGCQSTDDTELKLLGRIHTWAQFQESFQMAREAGFANLNVDLMSGLPRQNLTSWEKSLEVIAGMEPEHISAYSLIIEEGTPFAEKKPELPDEEEERRMYERTWEILQSYGYHQYEISNSKSAVYQPERHEGVWGIQRQSGIDPTGPGNTDSRGSDGRNHDSGPETALWCITERIQEKFRKIRRRSIRTGAGKIQQDGVVENRRRQDRSDKSRNQCQQSDHGRFSAG